MNNEKKSIDKENIETQNTPEKGPLSFLTGSLTSFLLCIFSYFISNKIKSLIFLIYMSENNDENKKIHLQLHIFCFVLQKKEKQQKSVSSQNKKATTNFIIVLINELYNRSFRPSTNLFLA